MITLALLLSQCDRSDEREAQGDSQGVGRQINRGAEESAPPRGSAELPTISGGYIIPRLPNVSSTLTVDVRVVDPLGEPVSLQYQWFVAGRPIRGATAPSLPPGQFVRREVVSVEVSPVAGNRIGPVWEAPPVEIGNAPPTVRRVYIHPSPATRRQPLEVVADVADPDGDEVTVSHQWLLNGTPIPGATEATLDPNHYRYQRGDWISVELVATDGEDSTPSLRSPEVDVLPAAPTFVSQVAATDFRDGRFHYQARAVHPDGRSLRYRLSEDAPEGMRVASDTGLVEWEPNPSQTGTFAFQVIVEDPEGARVAQPVTLSIGSQELAEEKE